MMPLGPFVGARDVAAHLAGPHGGRRGKGEPRGRVVSRLGLETSVVDRPPVKARRRSRLEAADPEREGAELLGERVGRRVAGPPALVVAEPDVDPAAEKGPGREHHRGGVEGEAHPGHDPGDPASPRPVLEEDVVHRLLEERKARLGLDRAADLDPVELTVDLGPSRPHGRAAARVQGAEVDAGAIRGPPHDPPEGVDLPHEMPLADPSDGRVAAHLAEGLDALGEEQGPRPRAHRGKGRLGPRVATPDHD